MPSDEGGGGSLYGEKLPCHGSQERREEPCQFDISKWKLLTILCWSSLYVSPDLFLPFSSLLCASEG